MREDLRSAIRQIRRNPSFVCAAVFTLALGAGAVTAVLTLADPMLFRPLPFPGGDRVFRASAAPDSLHLPDAGRAEAAGGAWESSGGYHGPVDIGRIGGATASSLSYAVSRGFLPALGVTPVVGRTFRNEEYTYSHPPEVAIITHGLWQYAFGGRPDVLERRLTFDGPQGHSYQIVGVLPATFFFPDAINQQPVALLPGAIDFADARPNRLAAPLIRLRPGVSAAAATAQLQAIARAVEQDYPAFERDRRVKLVPLREALFGSVCTPLMTLLAATTCVLLLASANLAQLMMARLRARQREIGIRLALGASRGRLVRQLSIESLVLAAMGGAAALATGAGLSRLAMAYAPELARIYRVIPPALDSRIAAITGTIVFGALVVFGLVPVLRLSRGEVRDAIQAVPHVHGVRRALGTDAALVFLQAAVAVALLVTGLLIVRSFLRLVNTPLGYDAEGVVGIHTDFPSGLRSDQERLALSQRRFLDTLAQRLGMPVAAAGGLPGVTLNTSLMRPDSSSNRPPVMAWPVSGEFFRVMRLTLVRGRVFTDEEAFSDAPVTVIDERAAALLWPGADPIGQTVKEPDGTLRTVVGEVRTVRSDLLGTRFERGGGFVPFRPYSSWSFLYRPTGTPLSVKVVEAMAGDIEPGATVGVRPLVIFERQLAQPRFLAFVLGALGSVALLLTLVGVFGIVTHEVSRRTKELGIRIALGADGTAIRRLVLKGALLPALVGGLLGLSASLWFTGTLRALLNGFNPYDPTVYAGTLVLVLVTVGIGTLGPSLRASRTDPMATLRTD